MATAIASPIDLKFGGLAAQIERRRDLMRRGEITRENGTGGYTMLGKLLELRYERTADHPEIPQHLAALFAVKGNVMDWQQPRLAPSVALDKSRRILLFVPHGDDVGGCVPPLPDVIDPKFQQNQFVNFDGNDIPLGCVPPEYLKRMREFGQSRAKGADQKLKKPPTIQQKFIDHCCGSMGEFLICRPVTEGWIQLAGVKAIQKIVFAPVGANYPGFYLDPATGEAHFLGGSCDFESPVG